MDSQKSPKEIKERALQAHREQAVTYNAAISNCEHFATWCVYGKKISGNVRVVATGVTITATTAAGVGGGAIVGGAIGSAIFPGVGTVVGGFIGGAAGGVAGLVSSAATCGVTIGAVHSKTEETNKYE